MPRAVRLPPHLEGSAFRIDESDFHGLANHRLRLHALDRPYRGVRSLGLDLSTVRGRCRAYLPLLGDKLFSHTTAAQLFGIPLSLAQGSDERLHVSAVGGTRPRGAGIVGHELAFAERTLVEEFSVVAAADTWCHLASMSDREQLVAAGDFLISGSRLPGGSRTRPICTLVELEAAIERFGRRPGAPAIRWALPLLRTGVDSVPETLVRLAIIAAGLDEPVIGHAITVADGSVLYPDLAYPDARVAIEYEGDRHRTDRERFRRDIRRYRQLEDAGWRVIRVAGTDPNGLGEMIDSVRTALAAKR